MGNPLISFSLPFSEFWSAEGPWCCKAVGQYFENKCAGLQGSGPSLRRTGQSDILYSLRYNFFSQTILNLYFVFSYWQDNIFLNVPSNLYRMTNREMFKLVMEMSSDLCVISLSCQPYRRINVAVVGCCSLAVCTWTCWTCTRWWVKTSAAPLLPTERVSPSSRWSAAWGLSRRKPSNWSPPGWAAPMTWSW